MERREFSTKVGGKKLTATFSDLAAHASGSALLSMGDTVVLATAVMSQGKREGSDYFPLTVDYEERFYAAGEILGSRYMRREGKPSDTAILSGRLIDRTIRPLFDQRIREEVQIIITVLALGEEDPDVLALNAASLALAVSDIPWRGPVAAVRVVKEKDAPDFAVNPTMKKEIGQELNLIVAGKDGAITMIEAATNETSEQKTLAAFEHGLKEINELIAFQKKIEKELGKEKRVSVFPELSNEARTLFEKEIVPKLEGAVFSNEPGSARINALENEWFALIKKSFPEGSRSAAAFAYSEAVNRTLHQGANKRGKRADGRSFTELRPLFAKAGGVSPSLHGSGIFYRGETHILSVLTLGGPAAMQEIDGMEDKEKKRFMHHYNFPPFSSGETGRVGNTNRREVGHGALAEKALLPVLPAPEQFPYTIRLVSEALSSNGSTSMASVCASSIALMDGGVPVERAVAGIAIGLMYQSEKEYDLLLDIQGPEDHHGDMDFKVAGTREGITAIQLDVKVESIPLAVIEKALTMAKEARWHLLEVMDKEIVAPRSDLKPAAPRVIMAQISEGKIGTLIGPGGRTVNAIKTATGAAAITVDNAGRVIIVGKKEAAERALTEVLSLTHVYKAGERVEGTVTRLADFGAFVEIGKDTDGLLHISEIAPFHIDKVTDVLAIGDKITVLVKEVDERGRLSFSLKGADPDYASRKGVTPKAAP